MYHLPDPEPSSPFIHPTFVTEDHESVSSSRPLVVAVRRDMQVRSALLDAQLKELVTEGEFELEREQHGSKHPDTQIAAHQLRVAREAAGVLAIDATRTMEAAKPFYSFLGGCAIFGLVRP